MDLAVERDMNVFFFQPIANEDQDIALELMKLPRAVVTFSDSGAHVSQLMDSSLQTHLLAYWVRERQAFTLEEAVRMLTLVPATQWGFHDRGLLRVGMAADMMVFDPNTIAAEMPEVVHDLPAGAKRLIQKTRGIAATVVNGEVLLREGKHTGALPGQAAARAARREGVKRGITVAGAALAALGALSLIEAFRLKDDWLGAKLMPAVVGVLLILLGVAHAALPGVSGRPGPRPGRLRRVS